MFWCDEEFFEVSSITSLKHIRQDVGIPKELPILLMECLKIFGSINILIINNNLTTSLFFFAFKLFDSLQKPFILESHQHCFPIFYSTLLQNSGTGFWICLLILLEWCQHYVLCSLRAVSKGISNGFVYASLSSDNPMHWCWWFSKLPHLHSMINKPQFLLYWWLFFNDLWLMMQWSTIRNAFTKRKGSASSWLIDQSRIQTFFIGLLILNLFRIDKVEEFFLFLWWSKICFLDHLVFK